MNSGELIISEFGTRDEGRLGKGVLFGTTLLFVFLRVNIGLVFAVCLGYFAIRITVAVLLGLLLNQLSPRSRSNLAYLVFDLDLLGRAVGVALALSFTTGLYFWLLLDFGFLIPRARPAASGIALLLLVCFLCLGSLFCFPLFDLLTGHSVPNDLGVDRRLVEQES